MPEMYDKQRTPRSGYSEFLLVPSGALPKLSVKNTRGVYPGTTKPLLGIRITSTTGCSRLPREVISSFDASLNDVLGGTNRGVR